MCQFLIGMVLKRKESMQLLSLIVMCQFLIGMVLKHVPYEISEDLCGYVSIPHRYGT